jgi:hypothetical protein
MSDRLQFLDQLALRPLFDMGVAGSWIYAGFSIQREPGDTGMFRERFTLKATKSKDGLVAGEFVLTMPYKRVSVPRFLPARVFSTVERPPIGDALEFFSSMHSVSYQRLDNIDSVKFLWAAGPFNRNLSSFSQGQNANHLGQPDANVCAIYECLLTLLLERRTDQPVYDDGFTRCFDLPRVWLAHGKRLKSNRDCPLEINCSLTTSTDFFREYALLARECGVVAQEENHESLEFRGLKHLDVAEAAAAFFPKATLVLFHHCNVRAISAFLRNARRVTSVTINSGLQFYGDTEDAIMLCGGIEFVETAMSHPALHQVSSRKREDGHEWITDYLTTCIQDRRSMGTLVELDAPSLDRAMHEQPGSLGAAGVASFFRNVLFERNVLATIRQCIGPADVRFLIDSIVSDTRMERQRPDPHYQWRTSGTLYGGAAQNHP